jgi:hypothetical protein
MSQARSYDMGRYIKAEAGLAPTTVLSSAGGSATNGVTIDRQALSRQYYSCRSVIVGQLNGTTVQRVSLGAGIQHSSDGSSWDNYSTGTNQSGSIGSSSAATTQAVSGVAEQVVNLRMARRYIRQQATPTFVSTSSGDSFAMQGVVVFGGGDEEPSS